jgi:hypothetical protein
VPHLFPQPGGQGVDPRREEGQLVNKRHKAATVGRGLVVIKGTTPQ